MRSGRKDRAQGITVAGICSLKQLTMKFSVGEETREAKIGWGIALCPSSLCESPCPTPSCFLGWQIPFPPLGSIIEGAEGGGLEEGVSLGPGPAPDTDTLSLLSLRTVASDLQKCDSVEHLRGLSDHASLDGQELGPRSGGRSGRHQRSISL